MRGMRVLAIIALLAAASCQIDSESEPADVVMGLDVVSTCEAVGCPNSDRSAAREVLGEAAFVCEWDCVDRGEGDERVRLWWKFDAESGCWGLYMEEREDCAGSQP